MKEVKLMQEKKTQREKDYSGRIEMMKRRELIWS